MSNPQSQNCIICNGSFQLSPKGTYTDRRRVLAWDAVVHGACVHSNHDGVVASEEFLARLRAKGVTPTLNARGHIDIPPYS